MKPAPRPPEQLLKQLAINTAALCRADLKLKQASQRRDELAQSIEKELALTRRLEQLFWLLMLASCIGFGYLIHLHFPHWLPEQWATVASFIKQL